MTYEQFNAWIVERRKTETFQAIADSLGVSDVAVVYWVQGATVPSRMMLHFASLLANLPDDVPAGLPACKRHRKSVT